MKNGAPLRSVFVCPCMFVVQARRGEIGNSLFSVEHGELENNEYFLLGKGLIA